MSVFGSLRSLVNWVLGADLSERPSPNRAPDAKQQVHRAASRSGDGFDSAPRAPRVVLDASVEAPAHVPDEPQPDGAVASMDFMASFDDLKDLVDEPQEPQPEFIPEGGMSTESLMREFELLAPADDASESLPPPTMAEGERPEEPQTESPPMIEQESAPAASALGALPAEEEVTPNQAHEPSLSATEAPAPQPTVEDRLAPAWLIPATTARPRSADLAPTDFNASLDDLAAPQIDDPGDKKG